MSERKHIIDFLFSEVKLASTLRRAAQDDEISQTKIWSIDIYKRLFDFFYAVNHFIKLGRMFFF